MSTDRSTQRALAVARGASLPAVRLKSATRYPLIYKKRIDHVERGARAGDLVAVYAPDPAGGGGESLLGFGLFNPKSEISVRIVRHGEGPPDDAFWSALLDRAVSLRRGALRLDDVSDAWRVVHAESDGLSGLVVDRFADVLSAEAFSLGMFLRGEALLSKLAASLGTRHWLLRPSPQFVSQEGVEPEPLASKDLPDAVTIREFGTRFRVRFEGGHKTGFFCDQRENRRRLAELSTDRTVLDLCCYSGGFSVQAKTLGKARAVTGVDLDQAPLTLARENANLNQVRIDFVQADAFTYMRDRLQHGVRYDVVVLDPPKLIRGRAEIEEGTRKHFDLNRLAMQLVNPGGLLLTCSCAGLLPEAEFLKLLHSASRQAGAPLPPNADGKVRHAARKMRILSRGGAAADHPVDPAVPETEYLKAVWVELE